MSNAFEREEARNPTMWVLGKKGMNHLHDAIGVRGTGFNRAPCGARPPIFGMQVIASEHVLPSSWNVELRGDSTLDEIKAKHRKQLREVIEQQVTCAICREAAAQFIDTMWAKWERSMNEGASASGLVGDERVNAAAGRGAQRRIQELVQRYGSPENVPDDVANTEGAAEMVAEVASEFQVSEAEAAQKIMDANRGKEAAPGSPLALIAQQYSKESGSSGSKTCPRCAEDVKEAARVCRFCGHEFEPAL